MFKAGEAVLIVSCADAPCAAGRKGKIVDEVAPGPLTNYRWTVHKIGILIGSVLCQGHELRKTGN
ncbi:hypothetical protein [Streptomyces sp. NPDC001530]|uniref:hypothetical protein n=1 Tax=Streptomyces sp. NPDC001530 TaxID=3364582 RepID=UPI00369C014C